MKPRKEFLRLLYAHEVLRRLGIDPDNIHALYTIDGLGVVVRVGGKEWMWRICDVPEDVGPMEFSCEWPRAVEAWNSMALDPAAEWGFYGSEEQAMGLTVMNSLMAKGIDVDPEGAREAMERRGKAN